VLGAYTLSPASPRLKKHARSSYGPDPSPRALPYSMGPSAALGSTGAARLGFRARVMENFARKNGNYPIVTRNWCTKASIRNTRGQA
jgi:hypothetical protein